MVLFNFMFVAFLCVGPAAAQFWGEGFWRSKPLKVDSNVRSAYTDVHPSQFRSSPPSYHSNRYASSNPSMPATALMSPLAPEDLQRLAAWDAKASSSPCWRSAVATFRNKCGRGAATDIERGLMAMSLMNCQLETDGRETHRCSATMTDPNPHEVQRCLGTLNDGLYPIYIQFRLHLDALCFYIGEEVSRERMERASRELHIAAELAGSAVSRMERKTTEMEDRMEVTSKTILRRFDTQLEAAQEQVLAVATLATRMAEQHEESLAASVAYQQSIKASFAESTAQLDGQRGILQSILASASNLTLHTQEQHQRMALSSSEMLSILDRVYGMQRSITDSFFLVQMVGLYLIAMAAVIILSTPLRTQVARPWSLLVLGASIYVEYWHIWGQFESSIELLHVMTTIPGMGWILPSEAMDLFETNQDSVAGSMIAVEIVAKLWRRLTMSIIVIIFFVAVACYESADARIRRIVYDAIAQVANPNTPQKTDPSGEGIVVKKGRGSKKSN